MQYGHASVEKVMQYGHAVLHSVYVVHVSSHFDMHASDCVHVLCIKSYNISMFFPVQTSSVGKHSVSIVCGGETLLGHHNYIIHCYSQPSNLSDQPGL